MSRRDDRAKARLESLRHHFEDNRDDMEELRQILVRINRSPDRVWRMVAAAVARCGEPALSDEEVGVIIDVLAPQMSDRSTQPRKRQKWAERRHGLVS